MTNQIQYFFNPRGVALIGASSNPNKLSNAVLVNLLENGYQGAVYPINPGSKEILGLTCYADISDVPDPVDLGVIMLPAPMVLQNIEACGKRGLKAVTIISGGFKEVGEDGADLEQECVKVARKYGMRLVGPNCVGTMDLYSRLNTTFIEGMPDQGHIGFISQSGAVCGAVIDHIKGKGIGFSIFASMGNEADVNETDLIEYLSEDPNTRVIAAYVEAIQDGQRFIQVCRRVSRKKPIVILKAGRSEAGERAVSSHTGSLAGSYAAYEAAYKQSGVIEAQSAQELFDIAMAFASQPLPKGKRAVIITNAGGPAALASDSISNNGIKLVDLQPETKAFLRERLNPAAQVSNPIDMLGGATPEEYEMAIRAAVKDENIDIVLPVNVPTSLVDTAALAKAFVEATRGSEKTVISCLMGDFSIPEARKILHSNKIPMYVFPEQMGSVLGAMLKYALWLEKDLEELTEIKEVDKISAGEMLSKSTTRFLGEAEIRPVLQSYGFPLIPGKTATSDLEAVQAAEELGYPVVMKIVSPQILHKSDAGGIKLNLKDSNSIKTAYAEIMKNAAAHNPEAELQGVLVESMAPKGHEMIVGMRRDPQFGPLVMFGMGGIYVELLTDISFRVAPLNRQDAREMIMETKAGKLLSGLRGQEPADIDAVVECIIKLAQLSVDFPNISEVEINPLLVFEKDKGALALDARAILSEK